ncbi:MAG: ArsR/SmtB family transcription factor [Opitutales bacterium]
MRNIEIMPSPTVKTNAYAHSAAGIFKALGHEGRVTIVRELWEGEKCVCELVDAVGLGWSTVSRHLSVLREAGIVSREKRGVQVFYRLALPCVGRFIACIEKPEDFPDLNAVTCACD